MSDGSPIVVEVEPLEGESDVELGHALQNSSDRTHLPPGTEPVGARDSLDRASVLLERQVQGLGALAQQAIAACAPSEFTLEAHIKFAGDAEVIPFLVSAQGEGGLKITMCWKKD